jgi:hypothetical protein
MGPPVLICVDLWNLWTQSLPCAGCYFAGPFGGLGVQKAGSLATTKGAG